MGYVTGAVFLVGLISTFLCLKHDYYRFRVQNSIPQAAPRRIPPELYALNALVLGIAVGLHLSWVYGVVAFLVYLLALILVVLPLLDLVSCRFPVRFE
jgi:hypothetical protein